MGGKVVSKVWKEGFQQVEAKHPMGGSKGCRWGTKKPALYSRRQALVIMMK
jgi:hypothetical protein